MITIVPMNEQNYKAVAEIEAACFSQPWSEKTFFGELSNQNAHTYVAYENGEAAGFLSVWEVCGEVSINNIAVSENYRRKGIARALLEKMLDELSGALYESIGFERVGERRGFYEKPTEDALLMTKILNGET